MASLGSVFNHMVLPPRLPDEADADTAAASDAIYKRVLDACEAMACSRDSEQWPGDWAHVWPLLHRTLCTSHGIHNQVLDASSLAQSWAGLPVNGFLVIQIACQNAALWLRRSNEGDGDCVFIEAFETSPNSRDVLAADAALAWVFPERAVAVPWAVFSDHLFRENMATFLEQASQEVLQRFALHSSKAGVSVIESRDTASPALLHNYLMPLLASVGKIVGVATIQKRIRDDVHIHRAELPWRRNPAWLVLRATLQRRLELLLGRESGRVCYKILMCVIFAQLLDDCHDHLSPERTLLLRAKLCRRLAKLEQQKSDFTDTTCAQAYTCLMGFMDPLFEQVITTATKRVDEAWRIHKASIVRQVPRLPKHADEKDLVMTLPRSGQYLRSLLGSILNHHAGRIPSQVCRLDDSAISAAREQSKTYFRLADLEKTSERRNIIPPGDKDSNQDLCTESAVAINDLLKTAYPICVSKPDQISELILCLFEKWTVMDQCAVAACPLLRAHRPMFPPAALDVLLIPTAEGLQRLLTVQNYLKSRHHESSLPMMSGLSDSQSFASHYLDLPEGQEMRDLMRDITLRSNRSRQNKEKEWRDLCREYDDHTEHISNDPCVCTWDDNGNRIVVGCDKCYHRRARKRMDIRIHEDFLPTDHSARAAVVFELALPPYLRAYRNTTWRIFSRLAHPNKPRQASPPLLLKGCKDLMNHPHTVSHGISLASAVKSFAQTHYKKLQMRVDLDSALKPFGAKFSYYDQVSNTWVGDWSSQVTFAHHCSTNIPRHLLKSVIRFPEHPPPYIKGPTSYETIANQTRCPPDASVHEFSAIQTLLAAKSSRWITVLTELASNNLNYSTENTMRLFEHLSSEAGPASDGAGYLRDVHIIFQDDCFCDRLAQQIEKRLLSIETNWREGHCMELLLTLTLRLHELAGAKAQQSAANTLEHARTATLGWISHLRRGVLNTADADTVVRLASYGFRASLLCRRTFTTLDGAEDVMDATDFGRFLEASTALQENLFIAPTKLDPTLSSMLMRDIKMVHRIGSTIKNSMSACPRSLEEAIKKSWSDSEGPDARRFSTWEFLADPNGMWVGATMTSTHQNWIRSQVVHYDMLEGHLLVDGMPLGKLPPRIMNSEEVRQLFDGKHLLTYPSSSDSMSHVLSTRIQGNQIHFGLRDRRVVVRTFRAGTVFEYIPPSVFRGGSGEPDLPASLIDGCTHWLDLTTKQLEIRRRPSLWSRRPGDWVIDLSKSQARRRESYLVDPHSRLSRNVKDIFRAFEDSEHITVFQPPRARLSVELKRMALTFEVNTHNLLECRELHAEVDPDQDAGTLYGFESKVVIRDRLDCQRRSVLVTLGPLSYVRQGMHVGVYAEKTGQYAKFDLDSILGRIKCLPEPQLLYTKALLHAVTSFPLPDPLTTCTGTEEALRTLRSGACQPWTPLSLEDEEVLRQIAALTPVRNYYPEDKELLQTVRWTTSLTTTVQHESLRPAVAGIFLKSQRLSGLSDDRHVSEFVGTGSDHLHSRGLIRQGLYERRTADLAYDKGLNVDRAYPRPDNKFMKQETNVMLISMLLRQGNFFLGPMVDVPYVLENLTGDFIGGFREVEDRPVGSLSTWIEGKLGERWGELVCFVRRNGHQDWLKVALRLGLLAFNQSTNMDAIRILCAFSAIGELRDLALPTCPLFTNFRSRLAPTQDSLQKLIAPQLNQSANKSRRWHSAACPLREETERLATYLLQQWPGKAISLSAFQHHELDIDEVMTRVIPEWTRLYNNARLLEHAIEVQDILKTYIGVIGFSTSGEWPPNSSDPCLARHGTVVPCLSTELILKGSLTMMEDDLATPNTSSTTADAEQGLMADQVSLECIAELESILAPFIHSPKALWHQYGTDLAASLSALRQVGREVHRFTAVPELKVINEEIAIAHEVASCRLSRISGTLSVGDDRYRWLTLGQLWPCTSAVQVLENLRSDCYSIFGLGLRALLVSYGLAITRLQWLLRLKRHYLSDDKPRLVADWREKGHDNWTPLQRPDWLLFEIDSDLLIRSEQVDVANAIIAPTSSVNSVLQLNMGKGKTSCIVPLALTVLANKEQLCRLVVPRALLRQTAQILQGRIGGLIGREVIHIPFSRRTTATTQLIELYADLHHQMSRNAGIVITTPESILSFKLSGLQQLVDSRINEARNMIHFQSWLDGSCRDVLDESDFCLAVKTQLIYPSGELIPVDGYPSRWVVTQALLETVQEILNKTQELFPRGLEIIRQHRRFPTIHILQSEVEDHIMHRLVDSVCGGQTSILQVPDDISSMQRDELRRILLEEELDADMLGRVSEMLGKDPVASKNLLVVRGLLVNRILILCLGKRWLVQYGLHPNRHPIAVPFEAKGVPSEQAEFGHPDVVILLTCLAYYYSGISEAQLKQSLGHILRSDDPASEYDRWTSAQDSLPDALRHWNLINVDDAGQIAELWRLLRFDTTVLNYYMNHFVFPLHAKQFTVKLQASGWDLPLSPLTPGRGARTTGFSGTNDNRRLLPLTIRQDDLPSLHQTNAEVLTYLLQKRNRRFILAADQNGTRWSEEGLLLRLKRQGIRILIDAGAAILELSNQQLVQLWLKIDTEAKAAVFFNNNNQAWIEYRGDKESVPLLATPFAEDMEGCLVYLDEAHTRGTDLKLPRTAQGAVTLALGQTKDHTVQAAMRLRQLATTQSVVFFASPEVYQSILDVCRRSSAQDLDSADVVQWLLEQTCRANERLQTLHAAQGLDFCLKTDALQSGFPVGDKARTSIAKAIKSPERLTLDEQYGSGTKRDGRKDTCNVSHPRLRAIVEELTQQKSNHSHSVLQDLTMQEVEQEREVEHQVEEVREVQKPMHYEALKFPGLHPSIAHFVSTGLPDETFSFDTAFSLLSRTTLGRRYRVRAVPSRLFLSPEFARTIRLRHVALDDTYFRPVQYILWSPRTEVALVVIPEEAEAIIPMLRVAAAGPIHLIAYAAPTTRSMLSDCRLDYFVLPGLPKGYEFPEWLGIELGILGARLYLSYHEYKALGDFLLASRVGPRFKSFLFDWLTLQRKDQDITMTPMGYFCKGKALYESHPFFNMMMHDVGRDGQEADEAKADRVKRKVTGPGETGIEETRLSR